MVQGLLAELRYQPSHPSSWGFIGLIVRVATCYAGLYAGNRKSVEITITEVIKGVM